MSQRNSTELWTAALGHAGTQLGAHQNTNPNGTRAALADTCLGFVSWELGMGRGATRTWVEAALMGAVDLHDTGALRCWVGGQATSEIFEF